MQIPKTAMILTSVYIEHVMFYYMDMFALQLKLYKIENFYNGHTPHTD